MSKAGGRGAGRSLEIRRHAREPESQGREHLCRRLAREQELGSKPPQQRRCAARRALAAVCRHIQPPGPAQWFPREARGRLETPGDVSSGAVAVHADVRGACDAPVEIRQRRIRWLYDICDTGVGRTWVDQFRARRFWRRTVGVAFFSAMTSGPGAAGFPRSGPGAGRLAYASSDVEGCCCARCSAVGAAFVGGAGSAVLRR